MQTGLLLCPNTRSLRQYVELLAESHVAFACKLVIAGNIIIRITFECLKYERCVNKNKISRFVKMTLQLKYFSTLSLSVLSCRNIFLGNAILGY